MDMPDMDRAAAWEARVPALWMADYGVFRPGNINTLPVRFRKSQFLISVDFAVAWGIGVLFMLNCFHERQIASRQAVFALYFGS
jgi:hypothetical protein